MYAVQLMLQSKHLKGNISWERWELRMLEKEMNAPEVMRRDYYFLCA